MAPKTITQDEYNALVEDYRRLGYAYDESYRYVDLDMKARGETLA